MFRQATLKSISKLPISHMLTVYIYENASHAMMTVYNNNKNLHDILYTFL